MELIDGNTSADWDSGNNSVTTILMDAKLCVAFTKYKSISINSGFNIDNVILMFLFFVLGFK